MVTAEAWKEIQAAMAAQADVIAAAQHASLAAQTEALAAQTETLAAVQRQTNEAINVQTATIAQVNANLLLIVQALQDLKKT